MVVFTARNLKVSRAGVKDQSARDRTLPVASPMVYDAKQVDEIPSPHTVCSSPMAALSPKVLNEFFGFCRWAYKCWIAHTALFPKSRPGSTPALAHLSKVSQEYALLQIVKLHDPAARHGDITLGLEFVVKYGGWTPAKLERLEGIRQTLKSLKDRMGLQDARNKVLAHFDLGAIAAWIGDPDLRFGAFEAGLAGEYFQALQEFVDTVNDGPLPFDSSLKDDMEALARIVRPTTPSP